jgi:hypothetical protein
VTSNPDGDPNASAGEISNGRDGKTAGGQCSQEDQKKSGHGDRKIPENVRIASSEAHFDAESPAPEGISIKKSEVSR